MASQRRARLAPTRRGIMLWLLLAATVGASLFFRGEVSLAYQLIAARHALREGNARRAVDILDQTGEGGIKSAEWCYLRARAERRSGHFAAAREQLDRAGSLGWTAEDLRREELLLKAREGQIKQVEAQLVKLLEAGPDDEAAEEIYETMSQAYWASYYVADSLKCLEFWIAWQPNKLAPRLWLADLYRRTEKPNAAEAEYRKILAIAPENSEALVRLGELLLKRLEIAPAAETFEQCLTQSPETADALLGLADCRRRTGAIDEVKDLLCEMLTLDLTPIQRSQALAMLGTLALEDRDYARAVQLLQTSVSLDANDPATHVSLAAALTAIGQDELAAVERQRGRDTTDRHARLVRTSAKAVEEPENADLRCEAGVILMEQGFWPEGADWVKTAIQIDPRHRAAHEAMAKYYDHIGDVEQAKRHRSLAQQAAQTNSAANGKDG